ncbi:MAG TPA: DUF362 domain-containing protein [Kofleriaceae bacterium]
MKRLAIALALVACGEDKPPPPAVSSDARAAPDAAAADTTSSASPVWTPGPAVEAKPSVDGAALRAKHRARLAADRSPVTILDGGTPLELGQKLCEEVVPKRPADTRVLVKPNLGGFDWFKNPKLNNGDNGVAGRTTNPEFVRGVVRCLKARGHTRITIADGFTGKAADWTRLAKVSGYEAMAREEAVTLVALDDDGVFDVEGDQPGKPLGISGMEKTTVPTLLVPKIVAEHLKDGLFISIPKLKAHRFSVFSLGIKAMQGSVMYSDASPAFRQKWRSHKELDKVLAAIKKGDPKARKAYVAALEKFAERMVDVLEIEAPDVVLLEGAPAMGGDGFQRLVPSSEQLAVGGTNVILVDRVGAELLGLWNNAALGRELGGHTTSPLLEVAAKRFGVAIDKPKLAGNGAALLDQPRPAALVAMAGFELAPMPKELHAVRGDPKIDGVVDEAWARATPLRFATDWAGRPTPVPTTVRAMWSERGLHLLWELEGTGLNTDQARPVAEERIDLYEEDCIELFLAPDPARRTRYFEIEVGPFGHYFDLAIDRAPKKSDPAWSGALAIGTTRDAEARRAIIELTIAAPEVLATLAAGAKLPVGLYRMEGRQKRSYLAAFPTYTPKPSFHVPNAFGTLILDP